MAKEKIKIAEEVAPNLVPMIDIMFLLLLFFMLSADMGQRELEEVHLPKAVSVKKDEEKAKGEGGDRLMINVYHKGPHEVRCAVYESKAENKPVCREESHWMTGIKGHDFKTPDLLEKRLKQEADQARDPKNPQISARKVMIRVDELAPYGLAQKAMNVCAKVGIYKIEVGAARPADEKKTVR